MDTRQRILREGGVMMAVANQKLSERWKTPAGVELTQRVIKELLDPAGDLASLPLERHEDRVDLRGIRMGSELPLPSGITAGGYMVEEITTPLDAHGVEFSAIDFTGSSLNSLRFKDCRIVNCLFDEADCRDWRTWGLEVVDSNFSNTAMRACHLGTWNEGDRSTYVRVDFSGADLKSSFFSYADFRDCDFSYADVDQLDFRSACFRGCRFAGHLRGTVFWSLPPNSEATDHNLMARVDFRDATLRFVEFRGLDLRDVTLPHSNQYIKVAQYPCVMRLAPDRLRGLPGRNGNRAARLLERQTRWINSKRDVGIWHEEDLASSKEECELVREVLHSCERECDTNHATDR
ncbi:pentapeptide repeat-containing protein [Streptomyces sp. NPDC056987]|uniref:pentapeptide repeat-containing protein n=1 Tax=Streptomyces sp. NPDC056987 TaxID=3345988 RepID=UPI00362B4F9F